MDKVIAISAASKSKLLEAGIASDRVHVVYSGLAFPDPLPENGAEAKKLRAEMGLGDKAVLIAHAAALTSEKRQADLISALARCARQRRNTVAKGGNSEGVHLAIAGSGALEAELQAHARQEGVGERVHFLGFKRDLRPLWAASALAAFASEAEGLCTALIEAQGAGRPAVITRAGGMVEVVEEEVTGLAVAVGDVEGLAEVLGRLGADEGLRQRLGRAARERARRLFSAEAMVAGTLRVYRSVLESKSGARGAAAQPSPSGP